MIQLRDRRSVRGRSVFVSLRVTRYWLKIEKKKEREWETERNTLYTRLEYVPRTYNLLIYEKVCQMDRWYRSCCCCCCCCGQARDSLSSRMVPFRKLAPSSFYPFLHPSPPFSLSCLLFSLVSRRIGARRRRKKVAEPRQPRRKATAGAALLHTCTQHNLGNSSRSRYARAFILLNWIFRLDESNIVAYGSTARNWKLAARSRSPKSGFEVRSRNGHARLSRVKEIWTRRPRGVTMVLVLGERIVGKR